MSRTTRTGPSCPASGATSSRSDGDIARPEPKLNKVDSDDTIVAIATAGGPAALALIRVSGRRAFSVCDSVFRGRRPLASRRGWTLSHGHVVGRGGATVDEVLAAVFRAPKSFTGEDMVELIGHGGEGAAGAVLAELLAAGARLAEPGEFTRRAYLNGRMDLAQAESVVDLIHASTARARESALTRLEGGLSARVRELSARARAVLLDAEAFLDFQEQLPEDFDWKGRAAEASSLASETERLLSTSGAGRMLREGARVVLCGRPNAGKSSLLNLLLGQDRALVSEAPGTTRDVLREMVDLGGVPALLIDTAGLHPGTRDAVEQAGMDRARRELETADVAVLVVDVSEAPDQANSAELAPLFAGRRGIAALNKVDLGERAGHDALGLRPVRISARTGEGAPEFLSALRALLMGDALRESVLVGTVRQEVALRTAAAALAAAAAQLKAGDMLDGAAFELREALSAFEELIGASASEEVLNEIFSRFCIGK